MSRRDIIAVIGSILAINAALIYRSMHANDAVLESIPPAATLPPAINAPSARQVALNETPVDLTWPAIQKTKVVNSLDGTRVEFAPELQAKENQLVRVSGVLFFVKDGIQNGKVNWCVLMPPSRYSCCGISCDPHQELMFFIDCSANPWPKPDGKMLAVVQGRLHLRTDDSLWCLYTLEDAQVTPLNASGVK